MVDKEDELSVVKQLEKLEKSLEHYMLKYILMQSQAKATQAMLERLDMKQLHINNLADLRREIRDLELHNQHLCNMHDTLQDDVALHVQEHMRQKLELVIYENTKLKLERAEHRHENDKRLSTIIADALSNAEVIWIATQLDLERRRKRSDNTDALASEAAACIQRTKIMRNLHGNDISQLFLTRMSELLSQHLGQPVASEAKGCLYEYEIFTRLLAYSFQNMLGDKPFALVSEQLKEIKRIEHVLKFLVYDGPVQTPFLEPVQFLKRTYDAKVNMKRLDKSLRALRSLFQQNITERLSNDKLWRYSQYLWLWFLTEPERMLMAIDEAKKAAANTVSFQAIKPLAGIKRKE